MHLGTTDQEVREAFASPVSTSGRAIGPARGLIFGVLLGGAGWLGFAGLLGLLVF